MSNGKGGRGEEGERYIHVYSTGRETHDHGAGHVLLVVDIIIQLPCSCLCAIVVGIYNYNEIT